MLLNCGAGENSWVPWTARGSVNPKGNQSWIFIGRTDAETDAEASIPWQPDVKSQLIGKVTWCWERLRAGGEVGDRWWGGWWHHRLNGHEFEQTLGDSEGQGSLAGCNPWGSKQSGTTDWQQNKIHKDQIAFKQCGFLMLQGYCFWAS